jgi:ankyrin repeat protein
VNNVDPNRNTALHIASIHVRIEIVQFLLRYYVSRTIKNKNGFTAEEIASNEDMKNLFKATIGLIQILNINSGYLDNEAPKGLGQHIFAVILINHPRLQPYYHTMGSLIVE